jgi:V/A-type H+/Na+-transporting ATPase subunit F
MRYRIAIVGPKEAVAGFALLGADVVAAHTAEQAVEQLYRLKKSTRTEGGRDYNVYGVVFVSEDLLSGISADDEKKLSRGALPAIVPLPSHRGSSGYGPERLRRIVERAIGSDILK